MLVLKQTYRTFSLATSLMTRRLVKRSNPGLGYQIAAIEDAADIIQSDPEGFGDLESDLMDAHKSYKQHVVEEQREKAKIRQCIVNRKYFRKDPLPNLLTYAEKEQIKFLHSSDKEEWTVEKLAESFPANTETISKILKAHWSPISAKRILSHDTSVFKNWERFKNGEYATKINTELEKHLQKFVDRIPKDLNNLQDHTKMLSKKQWQKPKSNEFISIISLQSKKNESGSMPELVDSGTSKDRNYDSNDTYLLGRIENKKPMTVKMLKDSLIQSGSDLKKKSLEKQEDQELNNINGNDIIRENLSSAKKTALDYTEKFTVNEVVINEDDKEKYGMCAIKERIYIPRKLRRKRATYRVNDCYYDDDGEFLYRVPGMTS